MKNDLRSYFWFYFLKFERILSPLGAFHEPRKGSETCNSIHGGHGAFFCHVHCYSNSGQRRVQQQWTCAVAVVHCPCTNALTSVGYSESGYGWIVR
jgi:hypothetical protein